MIIKNPPLQKKEKKNRSTPNRGAGTPTKTDIPIAKTLFSDSGLQKV